MYSNGPITIKAFDSIDPEKDKHWLPDDENMWFLPCLLDLKNEIYSGYWYGIKEYDEKTHCHRNLVQGQVLRGEMLMWSQNKEYRIKENEGFVLAPNTIHHAKLIPSKFGFLFYGTVLGNIDYIDSNEMWNVQNYYTAIKEHYQKHDLPFEHLVIDIK